MAEASSTLISILRLLTAFAASVRIQPLEERANTGPGEGDRTIRSSVIHVDGVAVGVDRISARKHDIVDVAVALVVRFGTENPRIAAQQALLWVLQSKE